MSAVQQQQTQARKLQALKDKLTMRKDDIVHIKSLLQSEAIELNARREQREVLEEKIVVTLKEMDAEAAAREEAKAARLAIEAEEQYLKDSLANLLSTEVAELQEAMEKAQAEAREADLEIDDDLVREVSVMFETEEVVFRVNEMYNFESLKEDSCRYFEVHPLDMLLTDDNDDEWPQELGVREELSKFDNQYGRVHLKFLQQEDDDLGEDPEDLLTLLAGGADAQEDVEEVVEEEPELVVSAPVKGQEEAEEPKKELNRKELLLELPSFLLFFLLFVISILTRRTVADAFYQINAVRTALYDENFGDYNEKAFEDIASFGEMFDWLEGVFIGGLFPDEMYDGTAVTPTERGNVMLYNKLVGAIRFRTVREQPNAGCKLAKLSRRTMIRPNGSLFDEDFMDECFAVFLPELEDKAAYGPAPSLLSEYGLCDGTCCPFPGLEEVGPHGFYDPEEHAERLLCDAFTYKDASQTKEVPFASPTGTLYPGGGFVRDVYNPINCEVKDEELNDQGEVVQEALRPAGICSSWSGTREVDGELQEYSQVIDDLVLAVEQLKSNLWLDTRTRAVIIKVAFYNGNTRTFVTARFLLEFTRGGVIVPSAKFGALQSEMYSFSPETLLPVVCEFIVYALIFKNVIIQCRSLYRSVRHEHSIMPYLGNVWNIVEITVLSIQFLSLTVRFTLVGSLVPATAIFVPYFVDYTELSDAYAQSFNLDGLCVVALFFQLFKYLQLSAQANMLWSVLVKSGRDIGFFVLMFFILLLGFGLMGEQMLGTNLESYSMLYLAIIKLFTVLMGDFDVMEFQQASAEFGIAFFFLYIVVMFLILMNIFLAILGEAYSMVREEADEAKAAQVKTKQRTFKQWLQLLYALFKAKQAARKAAKDAHNEEEARKVARLRTGGAFS